MIYPQTLYNFGKVCKSNERAGRVLRALCKQSVKLDEADIEWVEAIQNDNEWMNERIDDQRERWKERQRKARAKNVTDVTVTGVTDKCHGDIGDKPKNGECHDTSLPPSPPSSLPSSPQTNTNRSVPVPLRAHAHTRENGTERNENGTGDLKIEGGGLAEAKRMSAAFAKAGKADESAFFAPEFDPVTICTALTGDFKSLNRWRQLVKAKGEAAIREECFTFWREIRAGEDVDNRGATLNARLAALPDDQKGAK